MDEHLKRIEEFFDHYAASVETWRSRNAGYHRTIASLSRFYIPRGARVLEIGSGTVDLRQREPQRLLLARRRDLDRGHQFAPEKSLRRATLARAAMFTSIVMTNSARPVAIRAETPIELASANFAAMFAAMVCCWLPTSSLKE